MGQYVLWRKARIVACEMTMNNDHFSCSICGSPIITHVKGEMLIAPMAAMPDGRVFLRECALDLAKLQDTHAAPRSAREDNTSA